LTFEAKYETILTVMRDMFRFQYNPAVHEGQVNSDNEAYSYRVEIDEQFANRSENDKSAGLAAKNEDGSWKRFRFDGIQSAVAI